MREMESIWTWGAGFVSDWFGRVARFGVLGIRRASGAAEVVRRKPPPAAAAFSGLVCMPYLSTSFADLGEKG